MGEIRSFRKVLTQPTVVQAFRENTQRMAERLRLAADAMPAEKYTFRPTAAEPTFGTRWRPCVAHRLSLRAHHVLYAADQNGSRRDGGPGAFEEPRHTRRDYAPVGADAGVGVAAG
jgi:hypothetical protein